jgi:hypothetical protein
MLNGEAIEEKTDQFGTRAVQFLAPLSNGSIPEIERYEELSVAIPGLARRAPRIRTRRLLSMGEGHSHKALVSYGTRCAADGVIWQSPPNCHLLLWSRADLSKG